MKDAETKLSAERCKKHKTKSAPRQVGRPKTPDGKLILWLFSLDRFSGGIITILSFFLLPDDLFKPTSTHRGKKVIEDAFDDESTDSERRQPKSPSQGVNNKSPNKRLGGRCLMKSVSPSPSKASSSKQYHQQQSHINHQTVKQKGLP